MTSAVVKRKVVVEQLDDDSLRLALSTRARSGRWRCVERWAEAPPNTPNSPLGRVSYYYLMSVKREEGHVK